MSIATRRKASSKSAIVCASGQDESTLDTSKSGVKHADASQQTECCITETLVWVFSSIVGLAVNEKVSEQRSTDVHVVF